MERERENDKTSDSKLADDSAPPSKAVLFRMLVLLKLKLIASYILLGFAPFVAVIALIVAVMAMNSNKISNAQISQNAAEIESMSASLQTSKSELEKLKAKAALAQEKLSQENERKKQDERMTLIIQSVSKLQVKMKVSPTLAEQIHPVVSRSMIQPVIAPAVTVPVPVPVPVPAASAPTKSLLPSGAHKKSDDQIDKLKDAINKFNK